MNRGTGTKRSAGMGLAGRVNPLIPALALVLFVGQASAHEVGGTRFDAPLPLPLLLVGAGLTVGLTAVLLGVIGEVDTRRRSVGTITPNSAKRLGAVASVGFLVLVALALVAGVLGRQAQFENLATVFVWPVWLKGVGLVAIVAGTPWKTISPWRTTYRGLSALEGEKLQLRPYPEWLGSWPALAGVLVLVGVVENLTVLPRSPAGTAAVVATYGIVVVSGGVVFGERWFARADPLEVLYRLFGRVAPLQFERTTDGGYEIVARPPWTGTARPVVNSALAAAVVAAVYTVSFDGFAATPEFQSVLFAVRDATGVGAVGSLLLYASGFAGFLLAFWAVAAVTGRFADIDRPALAVAPTVIPIAAAYEVAHNYPYVLTNAGRLPATAGLAAVDPLAWLSLPLFWGSQVVLVVAGHVVAVVAAHRVVANAARGRRQALLAHAPLVVLMVGYTMLSLWIVSRPVVFGS